eukprot:Nitzschia sp. Nitz4//scaffold161_size51353//152//1045//NITZ4_006937-RA/size51353-processed-gene-0.15-mRNA-1//1//CDS//3329537876//5172//frame0
MISDDAKALPMLNIEEPTPTDILSGRGRNVDNHPGNKAFQELIKTKRSRYAACSFNIEKKTICISIVKKIRDKKGRFLKLASNGTYYDIGDQKAIKKTSQALREKVKPGAKQNTQAVPSQTETYPESPVKNIRTSTYGDANNNGMDVDGLFKSGSSTLSASRISSVTAGSDMDVKLTPSDLCPTVNEQGGSEVAKKLGLHAVAGCRVLSKCSNISVQNEGNGLRPDGAPTPSGTLGQNTKKDTSSVSFSFNSSLSNVTMLSGTRHASSHKIGSSVSGISEMDRGPLTASSIVSLSSSD